MLTVIEKHPKAGIGHFISERKYSWYEFTRSIYETMNLLDVEAKPVGREGLTGEMRSSLSSVLTNTKAKAPSISLLHWRDGSHNYLTEKYFKEVLYGS